MILSSNETQTAETSEIKRQNGLKITIIDYAFEDFAKSINDQDKMKEYIGISKVSDYVIKKGLYNCMSSHQYNARFTTFGELGFSQPNNAKDKSSFIAD